MTPEQIAKRLLEGYDIDCPLTTSVLVIDLELAIAEAEQRGYEQAIREATNQLCVECKAGTPVDPHWLPNLVMHSRDDFIIRCSAPHLRLMLESEAAP